MAPSPVVAKLLPSSVLLRRVAAHDYHRGYCALLAQLTTVDTVSAEQFAEQVAYWDAHPDTYTSIVLIDVASDRVVGSGTLVVERKIIHGCGRVGHIEDIVVDANVRGQNLGKIVVEQLKHIAVANGCYKIELAAAEKNAPFYEKCGFARKSLNMAIYTAH
ncbi:hypothetical protein CXG81DRAFT_11820 [Caulochytrium protostelioides]|uniref:Glucosamine 6-phosphate N-acetyltransferase n=1 Tax=Caulochytrium protostelioides TaxID=1555241 RepID=A0A4P9X987_9FUNG|nr:hypothetical protein CXG81DRAFT_11820 [Caulochytrium protostelioides]|eukprot:RKP01561.1 hypothetical protein CXG81DRAFT_11820 [Caulochytrium protostelioides]